MPEPLTPILGIVGPTASGKTGLAVRVAERAGFPIEVVSCDACQIYRGLDIGAGKPEPEELDAAPHHLVGVLDPDDPCSAGRFATLAAEAIAGIRRRGAIPLVVGGSGLYFRALRDGVFDGPPVDPALRARLHRLDRRRRGRPRLDRLLARLDPAAERRIHPNDRVRRLRALEVALLAGEPISSLRTRRSPPLGGAHWTVVALDPPRDELAARIARRVRAMFAAGFIEEALRLHDRHGDAWPGRRAIGYREILAELADSGDPAAVRNRREEIASRVIAATRRYAKRQRTWFRAERELRWLPLAGDAPEASRKTCEHFLAAALPARARHDSPAGATVPVSAAPVPRSGPVPTPFP